MPQYESLTNSAEFISDHFLTSDESKASFLKEVKALRKQWNDAGREGEQTTHSRFTSSRAGLVTQLASLSETTSQDRIRETYARLRNVLGFPEALVPYTAERSGNPVRVEEVWSDPGEHTEVSEVLWLQATPADTVEDVVATATSLGTVTEGETEAPNKPLGKLISDLYLADDAPKYIAAMAGRFVILTERERWPEGRFLAADAQLVAERNESKQGGEVDYLLAIFGRDSLRPAADGTIWWDQVLEESVSHAVAVSQDLREGVRRSIEIIANDVLARRRDQGLDTDDVDGDDLARQSLRYLYRILFLLYAEASPELEVLPVGAEEYDSGYGLDRLRELIQNDLTTPQSRRGTHFHDSLELLFQLVNGSHPNQHRSQETSVSQEQSAADHRAGLVFQPLRADLFDPKRTRHLNDVKLSNEALQDVLTRLLLSSEKRGSQRGFVSYANLGINQLGAVYEGLMSYSGFIAERDLHEVAPDGNSEKGSWVVPTTRSEGIEPRHFVTRTDPDTGLEEPALHRAGSFVFRLAGRERQQSASYYTPEVLTKFVVSQALEELLDQPGTDGDPARTTAAEILQLSICEPALGSGAFAIEAVRQLAEEYLKRRQAELDEQIPADEYALALQKVKAQIALHQVHGVDLNDTAVELAEVSLWLDTMSSDLQAPWFGLRLKRGNSLVGARRATYSTDAVARKDYLSQEPEAHPLAGMVEAMERDGADPAAAGRIHHFLLPGEDWGAAAAAKEVKDLAGENQKVLKAWQKEVRKKLSKSQITRLQGLSERVEVLWQIALRRLQVAESEARREINYWGKQTEALGHAAVTREEIERKLDDEDGVYQRLKRVMDAWNALWFWPVVPDGQEQPLPPDLDEWVAALEGLLGTAVAEGKVSAKYRSEGQSSFLSVADWSDLNGVEELQRSLSGMRSIASLKERHPWLHTSEQIAREQGFFHWELEFASVFAHGGFDLQVGNPPWVRPRSDVDALLAEHDPWWQLESKPTQAAKDARKEQTIALSGATEEFVAGAVLAPVLSDWLGAQSQYGLLKGLQPDLYRSFMVRTWRSSRIGGSVGLLHPESHFTEKKAGHLRAETYRRIRRHWQFINKKKLFADLTDQIEFGVHVYGPKLDEPRFIMAASLYVPETAEASLRHDGSGLPPALKTDDGDWDMRGHAERIIAVDSRTLELWASVLDEPGTPPIQARMVYPVNRASQSVLTKLAQAPRVRDLGLQYSRGWDESIDRRKGYFEVGSAVNESWDDVILQGPHFSVANPFAKQPRKVVNSNNDWDDTDLEEVFQEFISRTNYQLNNSVNYLDSYDCFTVESNKESATKFFRISWRSMAAKASYRTLYASVIPPGPTHVHAVRSASFVHPQRLHQLIGVCGFLGTLPVDFQVKLAVGSEISSTFLDQLPIEALFDVSNVKGKSIVERTARLVCLTSAYAPLWEEVMGEPWSTSSPVRIAAERRQLMVELDALAALSLGLTADELCIIYRTQFPVLRGYEQDDLYDANGRKVPKEMSKLYRKVGESGMEPTDLLWTHPQSQVEYRYEFPFRSFDREEDMREAYARFEAELG